MSKLIEMHLVPVSSCPLCGARESEAFDRGADMLMQEINRYLPADHDKLPGDLVNSRRQCLGCGLIYLSPRFSSDSLSLLYKLWYGFAYKRVMEDLSHVDERRNEFRFNHLNYLEKQQPKKGKLLDVGCGGGLFMDIARQSGWEVTGVEFDHATATWGREQLGLNDLRCGVLSDVLRSNELFDAITLFDYLEHTEQPRHDLDLLVNSLARNGMLMIRVPNATGWQARLMGARWLAIMPTHLSYFTPTVLRQALLDRGLIIEYQRAGNYQTQRKILQQRLCWLKLRLRLHVKSKQHSDLNFMHDDLPAPSEGGLVGAGMRWLRSLWIEQIDHVGGWFGAGNNLTIIARKP